MEARTTLSDSKRDEVLEEACQRGASVELLRTGQTGEQPLRSRLLRVAREGDAPTVVVELPGEGGRTAAIHEGETVEVVFQRGGQRLGFRSEILGRCFHCVREGTWVGAMVLSYPVEMEMRQRRGSYRVGLGGTEPLGVRLGEAGTGVVEDISTGGMGIRSRREDVEGLGVGMTVRVSFNLPGKDEDMVLVGEVRNLRQGREGGTVVGLEFVETDRTAAERRAVNAIGAFVAARQREILKKTQGMHE